tara:strand:+ start:332 stop:571 length:240 start_codon:yes stop_codon:yes gene_type:complete
MKIDVCCVWTSQQVFVREPQRAAFSLDALSVPPIETHLGNKRNLKCPGIAGLIFQNLGADWLCLIVQSMDGALNMISSV